MSSEVSEVIKMADSGLVHELRRLQRVVASLKAENKQLRDLVGAQRALPSHDTDLPRRQEWVEVLKGRKRRKVLPEAHPEIRNSFSVLVVKCSSTRPDDGKTEETTQSKGKLVVVGDSQVRSLGRVFLC